MACASTSQLPLLEPIPVILAQVISMLPPQACERAAALRPIARWPKAATVARFCSRPRASRRPRGRTQVHCLDAGQQPRLAVINSEVSPQEA
jgi:hypothetical protein